MACISAVLSVGSRRLLLLRHDLLQRDRVCAAAFSRGLRWKRGAFLPSQHAADDGIGVARDVTTDAPPRDVLVRPY